MGALGFQAAGWGEVGEIVLSGCTGGNRGELIPPGTTDQPFSLGGDRARTQYPLQEPVPSTIPRPQPCQGPTGVKVKP